MSKRKDPKDEAIAYVMTAPIDAATTFVQTLASVVKARAAAQAKPAAPVQKPATAARARTPVRDIRVVDPKDVQTPAQPGTEAPAAVS